MALHLRDLGSTGMLSRKTDLPIILNWRSTGTCDFERPPIALFVVNRCTSFELRPIYLFRFRGRSPPSVGIHLALSLFAFQRSAYVITLPTVVGVPRDSSVECDPHLDRSGNVPVGTTAVVDRVQTDTFCSFAGWLVFPSGTPVQQGAKSSGRFEFSLRAGSAVPSRIAFGRPGSGTREPLDSLVGDYGGV